MMVGLSSIYHYGCVKPKTQRRIDTNLYADINAKEVDELKSHR